MILETDGMANVSSTVGTTNGGAYNSYYNTPPLATISASGNNPDTDAINVATVLTSQTTTSSPIPGFSTTTTRSRSSASCSARSSSRRRRRRPVATLSA